jgi:hypothetical protein
MTALRRAAIILATAHRRRLLDLCLARLVRQDVPEGWTYDVVVSGTGEDFGRAVVQGHAHPRNATRERGRHHGTSAAHRKPIQSRGGAPVHPPTRQMPARPFP